jgi:hypothetical protein
MTRGDDTMATATKTRNQGKTSFLKEHLHDNPKSNTAAVNDAWKKAGMEGTIGPTLVNKIRAELGLTGNLRPATKTKTSTKKPKSTGKTGSRKPGTAATAQIQTRTTTSRHRQLTDVEADLDRLLFKVMGIGDLPRVEESLRETRRLLYRHMNH